MILINGATGSIGRFLIPHARNVLGENSIHTLKARLESPDDVESEIRTTLSQATPGSEVTLIPLAGMVSVDLCQKDPTRAHQINVEFLDRLVEIFRKGAKKARLSPRLLYLSSAHVYAASESRLLEDAPLQPRSVYAMNKREMEEVLSRAHLPVLILRLFGILGPEQPPNFLLPGLIRRVKEGRLSQIPGLELSRDYLDSRDVARLIVKALTSAWIDREIYNLCSGIPITVRDVLNRVIEEAPARYRSNIREKQISAAAGRSTDLPVLVGDPSKLLKWLGEPTLQIPLSKTVRDAWAVNALAP